MKYVFLFCFDHDSIASRSIIIMINFVKFIAQVTFDLFSAGLLQWDSSSERVSERSKQLSDVTWPRHFAALLKCECENVVSTLNINLNLFSI